MRVTGNGWADRRAAAEQPGGVLPDIGGHRKAPMGESFQSMGRMTGAAGFKRDSVQGSARGIPNAGLTGFSYNDPTNSTNKYAGGTQSSSFGMNQPTED